LLTWCGGHKVMISESSPGSSQSIRSDTPRVLFLVIVVALVIMLAATRFSIWKPTVWSSCFFFSSRRRHTRLQGDWSSDVCSSDLYLGEPMEKGQRVGIEFLTPAPRFWGVEFRNEPSSAKIN